MSVTDWLLDSDPAIRWHVIRDMTNEPIEVVGAERDRVAVEGWGAELLALQADDGRWDGGTYRPGWADDTKPFFDAWTATHFSLQLLCDLGVDPDSAEARRAISLVGTNVRWDANNALYFDGETEPCINGIALANGAYFGEAVDGIVDRLLSEQLDDGGWNCFAEYGATVSSFHTLICVLEGLLAWEHAGGSSEPVAAARLRGEEYLLERGLFRGRSTRQIVDPRFTMFSFPTALVLRRAPRSGLLPVDRRRPRRPVRRGCRAGGGEARCQGQMAAGEHAPGSDALRDGRARRLPQPMEHDAGDACPGLGGYRLRPVIGWTRNGALKRFPRRRRQRPLRRVPVAMALT